MYLTEPMTVCEQDMENDSEFQGLICERKTEAVEYMDASEIWSLITEQADDFAYFLKKQGVVIK